jgi:hypothetical protein
MKRTIPSSFTFAQAQAGMRRVAACAVVVMPIFFGPFAVKTARGVSR